MIFLGIDNGLDGGLVALDKDGKILTMAIMPTITKEKVIAKSSSGKVHAQKRRFVDERALLPWLQNLKKKGDVLACLERPTFAKDYKAATSMADSFATTRTVLRLLGIPVKFVDPKDWQAYFWKRPQNAKETGWTTKKQAWRTVVNNWSGYTFLATQKSKNPHDGMVDACLIAEYRRRIYE